MAASSDSEVARILAPCPTARSTISSGSVDLKDHRRKRGSKFRGNECKRALPGTRLVFRRNRKSDRADRKFQPDEFAILGFLAGCFMGSKDISIKHPGRLDIGHLDVKHSTFPCHVPINQQRRALSLKVM